MKYLVHCWGGAFEKHKEIKQYHGYNYVNSEDEKEKIINAVEKYRGDGLMIRTKEEPLSYARTVACMTMIYKNKPYYYEYDFGYEYEEGSAQFMFFCGNYSCDCNKSIFLQEVYKEVEELDCGEEIQIENFKIEIR